MLTKEALLKAQEAAELTKNDIIKHNEAIKKA